MAVEALNPQQMEQVLDPPLGGLAAAGRRQRGQPVILHRDQPTHLPQRDAPLLAAAAAFAAFSSSMTLSLASYSSFLAFHSFLLLMMPSNMGWICGWKRENSWKTRWDPNKKEGKGHSFYLNPTARWEKKKRLVKSLVFNLVDKRADKVDEAALQLRKLCCLRPVHHGLGTNNKHTNKQHK